MSLQVVSAFDGGDAAAQLAAGDATLQRRLAAAARLEAAAVEQAYGDVKAAEAHLTAAETALGMSFEMTGTLLGRLICLHLQSAKSQIAKPRRRHETAEAYQRAGNTGFAFEVDSYMFSCSVIAGSLCSQQTVRRHTVRRQTVRRQTVRQHTLQSAHCQAAADAELISCDVPQGIGAAQSVRFCSLATAIAVLLARRMAAPIYLGA